MYFLNSFRCLAIGMRPDLVDLGSSDKNGTNNVSIYKNNNSKKDQV